MPKDKSDISLVENYVENLFLVILTRPRSNATQPQARILQPKGETIPPASGAFKPNQNQRLDRTLQGSSADPSATTSQEKGDPQAWDSFTRRPVNEYF